MAAQDQAWTVLRLIEWTRNYFSRAGVHDARLAAEVLLAHVLQCRRIDLYARFADQPNRDQLAAFRELVARARAHEPVAYLVGRREFYSLDFKVTPDVLIPRPESEILVSEAVAHLRSLAREGRMWDVCTGCGCVGIAAASQVENARVLCTDISPPAVAVAARNAEAHGLGERVHCAEADMLTLPDGCDAWRECDVIAANPPYVAESDDVAAEVAHEPDVALYGGPKGLDFIRRLIPEAGGFLVPGGKLTMEFGLGQADAVMELIEASGLYEEPEIRRDHQDLDRTAVAYRRR